MNMDTTDLASAPRADTLEPTIVTFAVADPEVLLALSEHPDGAARTNFLVTALKVGVLSLKAAAAPWTATPFAARVIG
jgi:hypothetical protein